MKISETSLKGVYVIEPKVNGDHRGYFMETFKKEVFDEVIKGVEFVQDNESFTQKKEHSEDCIFRITLWLRQSLSE